MDLGESDERGDAGGEDDEDQTHNHVVGGLGIVSFPIADNWPAGTEVHDAQSDETDDGDDRRNRLRRVPNVVE